MTVSSTTRKAGPFTGNGSQTVFPFTFKVFTKYDLEVVRADTSGTETTLVVDSDYTVFLNADQDNSPGGTITLSAALASGYLLVVVGDLEFSQDTDLPTGGAFNATNVENALDRLTMLCQQLRELTTRAVSVGPTSSVSGDQLLVEINQAVVDSAASAASALLSLNTFKAQYYGVLAADPTLDPLGGAMTQGDLYFSSALLRMRAYTGSAWADVGVATPVTINTQRFSGTGAQTVFTLTNPPAFQNAADVFVGGVVQVPGVNYTITGAGLTTLTFLTGAPPLGTNNIFVKTANAYAGGVPNDGSVTAAKMAAGAATGAALGADVVQTTGAQTLAGVKTFSSPITLPDSTSQGTAFLGRKAQTFTSNGTFTIPAGITALKVTLVGGGGGSGGALGIACTAGATSGGGGGGTCISYLTSLTPGATLSVTIGGAGTAGAASGTAGGAGGNSTLTSGTQSITTVTAGGGGGSAGVTGGASFLAGGASGSATNGTINIPGQKGQTSPMNSIGGTGGSSQMGFGGTPDGLAVAGTAGVGYGAGASGAAEGGTSRAGAVGTAGIVIFEW